MTSEYQFANVMSLSLRAQKNDCYSFNLINGTETERLLEESKSHMTEENKTSLENSWTTAESNVSPLKPYFGSNHSPLELTGTQMVNTVHSEFKFTMVQPLWYMTFTFLIKQAMTSMLDSHCQEILM